MISFNNILQYTAKNYTSEQSIDIIIVFKHKYLKSDHYNYKYDSFLQDIQHIFKLCFQLS